MRDIVYRLVSAGTQFPLTLRRWLPRPLRPFAGYVLALTWVGAATAATSLVGIPEQETAVPSGFFYMAVTMAAFGGIGPGIFAVALSGILKNFLFPNPGEEIESTGVFLFTATAAALVVSAAVDLTGRYRAATVHFRLLSRIGVEIDSAASFHDGVSSAASIPVPDIADVVVVDLLEGHRFRRSTASVEEPAAQTFARLAGETVPDAEDEEDPIVGVLRTGTPLFWPKIPEDIGQFGVAAEQRRILGEIETVSSIAVPIAAQGQLFGVMTFVCLSPRAGYEARDLDVALEIGRRIGVRLAAVKLLEELTEANEAKDVFLGMISHEMRTPLTVFGGYTEMLQRRWDELPQREINSILSEMARQSDRLLLMVENMLVVARSDERRRQAMEMEPVLLQRFLPDLCREQSHERGREIGGEIDATLPPVLADEGYLRQVLQNLLSNADKYSPQGKPVDVSAEREGLVVRVIVADRGPGIAREHLDAIFEPFVRMQGGTAVPGAGLGLAVCQRLVEAMGGRMNLRPRPGGGSEFSFTVPVLGDEFGEPEQREQAPAASEARPRAGLASD
ncbi:MAG TPA: ATP-binding protein [Tepidiformaceae bacterium]|nr:ATP-binding protein [Tepidiformaceae bacterium]